MGIKRKKETIFIRRKTLLQHVRDKQSHLYLFKQDSN